MSLVTNESERKLLAEARDLQWLETSTAKFWMAIFHREFPLGCWISNYDEGLSRILLYLEPKVLGKSLAMEVLACSWNNTWV